MIKNIQKIMSRDIIYNFNLKTHPSNLSLQALFTKEDPIVSLSNQKGAMGHLLCLGVYRLIFTLIQAIDFYFRRFNLIYMFFLLRTRHSVFFLCHNITFFKNSEYFLKFFSLYRQEVKIGGDIVERLKRLIIIYFALSFLEKLLAFIRLVLKEVIINEVKK